MSKPKLFRLADKYTTNVWWNNIAQALGLGVFAFGAQRCLQLEIAVKMVLDRPFVAPSHKNQRVTTSRYRLFCCVLDQGFVDHRQQLFRHCLGHRQKPCSKTGNWKYSLANNRFHRQPFHCADMDLMFVAASRTNLQRRLSFQTGCYCALCDPIFSGTHLRSSTTRPSCAQRRTKS